MGLQLCVFVTVHADDSASPSPSADLTTLSLAVIWEFFPGLLSRYPHPVLVRCPLFPCSHSILSTPWSQHLSPRLSPQLVWEFLEGNDYAFLLSVSAALNRVLGTWRVNEWMGGMNE